MCCLFDIISLVHCRIVCVAGRKLKGVCDVSLSAGPWVHKLHLADNGIDGFGDASCLGHVNCMTSLQRYCTSITHLCLWNYDSL